MLCKVIWPLQDTGGGSREPPAEIRVSGERGDYCHFSQLETHCTEETPSPLPGTEISGRVYHTAPQAWDGGTSVRVGTEPVSTRERRTRD